MNQYRYLFIQIMYVVLRYITSFLMEYILQDFVDMLGNFIGTKKNLQKRPQCRNGVEFSEHYQRKRIENKMFLLGLF